MTWLMNNLSTIIVCIARQTLKNYENNSTFDVLLFFFIKTIKYSVNSIDITE